MNCQHYMSKKLTGIQNNTALRVTARGSGRVQVALDGEQVGTLSFHSESWAAEGIAGLSQTAVFSFGSDGTDGPTDAAGGYVDGESLAALNDAGLCFADILQQNDAYPALAKIGGLIMTGPTGTNVNDLAVLLLAR